MRKIISLLLLCSVLFCGCSQFAHTEETSASDSIHSETSYTDSSESSFSELEDNTDYSQFSSLSDPNLLSYVEDDIYSTLDNSLEGDKYEVLNVSAIYVSKEYLEESEYNSKTNIYWGYTLEEIEEQYGTKKPYVFTLGEDGKTAIETYEPYVDHFNTIVRNVMIGTGVILVSVTISVCTGGTGSGASVALLHTIFASSAKTASVFALEGGGLGFVTSGIIKWIETGDYQEAFDDGLISASEGFKWGSISGSVSGGISGYAKAPAWMKKPGGRPSWRDSEQDILRKIGGDLPKGSTQQIILDTRGRNITQDRKNLVLRYLSNRISDICPYDVPISFF